MNDSHRRISCLALNIAWFGVALGGAVAGEPSRQPWSTNRHSSDVARQHVEFVTEARHEYSVLQHGTMDGENCRSPVGVFEGWEQSWESNRSVRLENAGRSNIVNPWLSNGRNDVRTPEEIVRAAIEPGMTDREKAIAIWHQETQYRFHFSTWDEEDNNPVKVFNSYGFNTCGDDSMCLAGLWRRAGLPVRPARIVGHCVSQVFYDGRWHLLDGDMHATYLLRDNKTIASENDLVRDHDLIKRSRTHGILAPDSRQTSEWEASLYVYEGDAEATRDMLGDHTMEMVLRPGEAITWQWGHLEPIKYHGGSPPKYPDRICNGSWDYTPELSSDVWRQGALSVAAVRATGSGIAAVPGHTGQIEWKIACPYVIVGGRLQADAVGAKFYLSWDRAQWQPVASNLDRFFPADGPARYEYFLRCELPVTGELRQLQIHNDLQMAPLAMPGMHVGANRFVYSHQSADSTDVHITHDWVERSASSPPAPPESAIHPEDGSTVSGTDIRFRWSKPIDPDGHATRDYHFQLAERSDMKWPLSPNFDKLVSRTDQRGKAEYQLPQEGLLNSGQTYYWRVRAQDDAGVWGRWSDTWSFTPTAPAHPLAVEVDYDPARNIGVLRWQPNPSGREPSRFRVYGSDEKGFSVHDESYERFVGNQQPTIDARAPANFLAETTHTELEVIGSHLMGRNANRAYYRVVAVDEDGARSTASEFATSPRPLIYSVPATAAAVGSEYRYAVAAIRSLGDLRCRSPNGELAMNYWDVERPQFSIERGPQWLTIDSDSGLISGRPAAQGSFPVVVSAAIDREVRVLDNTRLSWGQEQVLDVLTEHVGTARQQFVIRVE